jgi:antagonist of KipI
VIRVLQPGLFTTVQDLGREGFGPMGVSPSGAADAVSLRVGNLLVGNFSGAAALEMTLLGGTFLFPEGGTVALAGSDFGATLDGVVVEGWSAIEVRSGQTLQVGATRSGARCYLCVRGGIAVEPFLGSASTHILSGLGGFEGRALRKGDVLAIGEQRDGSSPGKLCSSAYSMLATKKTLRVTPGPQRDWFDAAAKKLFGEGVYRVTEEANRMGLRLAGPAIKQKGGAGATRREALLQGPKPPGGRGRSVAAGAATPKPRSDEHVNYDGGSGDGAEHRELISEGVALGAVQIPESGQPIILFVEQQTAGGYPKIANVISADFHSLGQLRPRDEVRFDMVDWEAARRLLIEQEALLASEELFA